MINSTKKVMVIGAGRVGILLGEAVQEVGATVTHLTTRSPGKNELLAKRFPGSEVINWRAGAEPPGAALVQALNGEASVLLITVRDDLLPAVAREIAQLRSDWQGWSVVHCSGGTALSVLEPFSSHAASTAVLHPCYPVLGAIAAENRSRMVWTVEASSETLASELAGLVTKWGAQAVSLNNVNRTLYHAAQVIGAGHVVALYAVVEQVLAAAGLSGEQARQVISSLLAGIQSNLLYSPELPLAASLTGPFVRGDTKLIEAHQESLRALPGDAAGLYALLGAVVRRLLASTAPGDS